MKQTEHRSWLSRFGGYLAIPHELLHVAGYRLVGQRCEYHWGNSYITSGGQMTLGKQLVGTLFPFVVFAVTFLICGVLSGLAYGQALREGAFFWFFFWTALSLVTGSYAGTAAADLRRAYLLIFNKPWYSWTPFDIFYWPLVDWSEVRKEIAAKEKD